MIGEILQKTLPQAYGLNRGQIILDTTELTGDVILSDRCANCTTKQRYPCNEQNLRVNIGRKTVTLINHEDYINQFNDTQFGKGKTCDYMLVDDSGSNHKVAFCELTCSLAKTVEQDMGRTKEPEGKRAKAMIQLEESALRLTAKEVTRDYLVGFHHRHCIFGWRDPFVSDTHVTPQQGDAEANMMIMGIATSGSEPLLLFHKEIDGLDFVFYQVKYPTVYNW